MALLERGHGEGVGLEALAQAFDGGGEAFEDGGDGQTVEDGFGADFEAVAHVVGPGAGGVDDPVDLLGADEVERAGVAFADAEDGVGAQAVLPEGGGGAAGGGEGVAQGGQALGGLDACGLIGIAEREEDGRAGGRQVGAGGGLTLRYAKP